MNSFVLHSTVSLALAHSNSSKSSSTNGGTSSIMRDLNGLIARLTCAVGDGPGAAAVADDAGLLRLAAGGAVGVTAAVVLTVTPPLLLVPLLGGAVGFFGGLDLAALFMPRSDGRSMRPDGKSPSTCARTAECERVRVFGVQSATTETYAIEAPILLLARVERCVVLLLQVLLVLRLEHLTASARQCQSSASSRALSSERRRTGSRSLS